MKAKKSEKRDVKESIFYGAFLVFLALSLGFGSGCAFRGTFEGSAGPNAEIRHQEEKSSIGSGTVQEFRKRSAQTD